MKVVEQEEKRGNMMSGSIVSRGIAMALALMMMLSLVACGRLSQLLEPADEATSDTTTTEKEKEADVLSDLEKLLDAEGRPYNNVITGEVGDTLTNTFFDWTVNSVTTEETLTIDGEEFEPEGIDYKFVLVDITTKNVYDQVNPMSCSDFTILWDEDGETTEDVPYGEFMDGMYPEEFDQAVGESDSGILVFEVPKNVDSVIIAYYELWEDDFEGDTYLFEVDL
ncbi:MAG: DUF4352 domain-containing protein [Coriobacteriales bacterium]|nr:DUF4352 domain-containing protein [Coriobacteriales bacterium]